METEHDIPEDTIELPWMPIYLDKMISGTDHMDAAEFGGYIRLLIEQFQKGHITSDIKKLKKLARLNTARLSTVLEKFKPTPDGNLQNKRCAIIRGRQMEMYVTNKTRATKAGKARQQMVSYADGVVNTGKGNSTFLKHLRQKSIDSSYWLQLNAEANEIPVDIVKTFCTKWLADAELRMLHEKHEPTALLGFMLDDMRKAKPGLLPVKAKVLTDADMW